MAAMNNGKNGRAHVLEISNRATVQKIALEDVTGITNSLDNHYSGLNTNAHQIGNIAGLQTALNDKADASDLALKADVFTGFTGVLNVVTFVDFPGEAVTTAEITIENGIIISVD